MLEDVRGRLRGRGEESRHRYTGSWYSGVTTLFSSSYHTTTEYETLRREGLCLGFHGPGFGAADVGLAASRLIISRLQIIIVFPPCVVAAVEHTE